MRVLVVDDSRAMRSILKTNLRELGFETAEAADGQEGLDRLADHGPFDAALVDWNMPVMNGLEFVTAVRARPELAGLRLMMVTTEVEMEQVARAIVAGADEYVMKPFTSDILREKLGMLGLCAA